MESRESWDRRWQLAKQRTDAKIIELHQISGNVQKNPPDLIVTKNLKKKHYGAVDKLTKELKQLLHSDFQQVENKYLEISKVWSYTEKILTKIIYAREAEQSIKDFYFDQVVELRRSFDSNSTDIGRNFHESDHLRQSNTESYNHAKALWTNMYKSVDRAKELSILEPMCNKLDKEWTELINGLAERDKILKEATSFWKARDSFDWQCKTWIRHLNDFLKTEPAGSVSIEEAEEFGKYAEEYGTMCYSQHKIVASNGKKLLSLLQGKITPIFNPNPEITTDKTVKKCAEKGSLTITS